MHSGVGNSPFYTWVWQGSGHWGQSPNLAWDRGGQWRFLNKCGNWTEPREKETLADSQEEGKAFQVKVGKHEQAGCWQTLELLDLEGCPQDSPWGQVSAEPMIKGKALLSLCGWSAPPVCPWTRGQPIPLQASACHGFLEYAGHPPAYGFFMCSSLCPKCPSPRKPHDSLPLLLQILPGTLLFQGDLSHLCLLTLFITHFLGFFSPYCLLASHLMYCSFPYCIVCLPRM